MQKYVIKCSRCGLETRGKLVNRCPRCGGILNILYDYNKVTPDLLLAGRGRWFERFEYLLPIEKEMSVSLGEGDTALIPSIKLADKLGVKLYLKNETTNPTGSFVDRGSMILTSILRETGVKEIDVGYSPNFTVSISAYLTRFGFNIRAFLPTFTSLEKLYQLVAYGADIHLIEETDFGNEKRNLFDQGNPYFLEGLKSTGFEIILELIRNPPDFIIVPLGTGSHLSMIWKAMVELRRIGFDLDDEISLIGVQSEKCVELLKGESGTLGVIKSINVPDDLCVEDKGLYGRALEAIKSTGGTILSVSDEEILKETLELARKEAIFPEPSGAASMAGLKKALELGFIDRGDVVVAIITGSGLKDHSHLRDIVESNRELREKVRSALRVRKTSLGSTKHMILEILEKGPLSVYEIWKKLRTAHGVELSYPTIHQHIKELEESGFVEGRQLPEKRRKKIYKLTNRGKELIKLLK